MVIYITTNLLNGKIYIGQDSHNNPRYFGSGKLISRAILKYGVENFKKEILCKCETREDLNEKEIYWIKELRSQDPEIGYNLLKGGDHYGGLPGKLNAMYGVSKLQRMINKYGEEEGIFRYNEYKRKVYTNMSTVGDKNGMHGKSIPHFLIEKYGEEVGNQKWQEIKRRISDSNKGKTMSEASKQKISNSKKGKRWSLRGSIYSKELDRRILITPVCCFKDEEHGNVIQNREEFIDLYYNQLYSIPMLCKHYQVQRNIVHNSFRYYNITVRTPHEEIALSNKRRYNKHRPCGGVKA